MIVSHLRQILKERHLSVRALAAQAQLSKSALQRLCTNSCVCVHLSMLDQLCVVLDVQLHELIAHISDEEYYAQLSQQAKPREKNAVPA